jgi:5-methylcytosine-specific restriction enzyme A
MALKLFISTKRVRADRGWCNPRKLPKGPNDRNLCRWCSQEVPKGRRTFCSDACVHEHKLRSDSGYLRGCVWERDQGVCAKCGLDTKQFMVHRHGRYYGHTGHLWQADHIKPVVEGGGECGLGNLRTLCTACHKAETKELAARRAQVRKASGVTTPRKNRPSAGRNRPTSQAGVQARLQREALDGFSKEWVGPKQ